MAQPAEKRTCGSCGKAVTATGVMCPHCGVLLAAYEAPSGSDTGTAAALTPVDMSSTPAELTPTSTLPGATIPSTSPRSEYVSPVAEEVKMQRKADTARDRSTETFSAPSFDTPEASPIIQAVKEMRNAADQPDSTRDAPVRGGPRPDQTSASRARAQIHPEQQRPQDRDPTTAAPGTRAQTVASKRPVSSDSKQQARPAASRRHPAPLEGEPTGASPRVDTSSRDVLS